MHSRYFRWLLLWLVVASSLLILGAMRQEAQAQDPRPEVGHPAPDFTLPDLNGKRVRLSDFRGKKAAFVNFWATWCAPCRLEMPTMEKAYQNFKGKGLEILAVSVDAGPKSVVKNFMQELKLTFPALLDPDMEVLRLYRISWIPATFLVDKQGVVRHRELGYRDWTDPGSTKILDDLVR